MYPIRIGYGYASDTSWIRIPGVSQKSDTYWLGYLYRIRLGGMGYGTIRQTDLQARLFRVTYDPLAAIGSHRRAAMS